MMSVDFLYLHSGFWSFLYVLWNLPFFNFLTVTRKYLQGSKLNEDSEDDWQIMDNDNPWFCRHVVNSIFLTFFQTILRHILVNVSDAMGWTN